MRSLLGLLKKLENEFRQPSEQFRVETPYHDGGGEPGFQEFIGLIAVTTNQIFLAIESTVTKKTVMCSRYSLP